MANHHYLPQFYLKGFTNGQGKFLIYSIAKGQFKGGGKLFAPASHFFIEDDNFAPTEGWSDNYLEEIYSVNESKYARILNKIKVVDQGFGLDNEDVVWLNYFAGELFWRVPAQRELIESATSLRRLNELGVATIDRRTMRQVNPDDFAEWVKDDPLIFKRLRNVIPATTYRSLALCKWPCSAKTFTNPFPAVCSDNPVMLRHPEKCDPFVDDLIFPLAPNKVFFRIQHMKDAFLPNLKFYMDMLMVAQAKEYVCGTDKKYITRLVTYFQQNFKTVDELRNVVFSHLTIPEHLR